MICPKCGRTIPDGAQCSCSMGTPILSSNPAVNVIKTIGSSPLFLVVAILMSVSLFFSLVEIFISSNSMENIYDYLVMAGVDPSMVYSILDRSDAPSIAGQISGNITTILITIGVWLFYFTSKDTQSGNVATAGLTICKVITYISLIIVSLVGVIVIACFVIALAAGVASSSYYDYSYETVGALSVVIVVVLIFIAVFMAIYIIYEVCVIKTINRIKATAMSGIPDNRIPGYLIVMNYISAAFMAIGGLTALFSAPLSGFTALASAATMVLISLCLTRYRKEMTMLMYPTVQPTYAAPVHGGYTGAQAQVPTAPMPQPPVQYGSAAPQPAPQAQPMAAAPQQTPQAQPMAGPAEEPAAAAPAAETSPVEAPVQEASGADSSNAE